MVKNAALLKSINKQKHQISSEFEKIHDQPSLTSDGIIFKGTSIVIPASLQKRAEELEHLGHMGETIN